MTSFPAAARRVRDEQEPLRRRLWALRECALRFGPYGFRATWHHLIVRNGIPEHLGADPHSLVRAVDELGEARDLWLPQLIVYERRRRVEKAMRRVPDPADLPRLGLYCPDPEVHPGERLSVVIGRVIERWRTGAEFCAGCAGPHVPVGICPTCGVCEDPRRLKRAYLPAGHRQDAEERWKAIWQRRLPPPRRPR
ncbi:hypothetical protein Airi01_050640 [Actinoallomurus iriomotensis]|uniref:Uncharacterized protein n=1 Tax=Actinoallomurus iriomotensis TaxID=478107 RepID=A0A9W6RMM3_9ACTN|nr:hypothetical protein Airi01_050640 [Actinoallomurus iriomotensis]